MSRWGINKWAILSIVIGIIALTAVAVELASGDKGTAIAAPTGGKLTNVSGTVAEQTYGVRSGRIDPATIIVPKQVSVPSTGIFIRIHYLGAFNGSYYADNEQHHVVSSGDQLFSIQNLGQTISGTFRKTDLSARQELIAEVWKDGQIVTSNSSKLLFGEVRITANV